MCKATFLQCRSLRYSPTGSFSALRISETLPQSHTFEPAVAQNVVGGWRVWRHKFRPRPSDLLNGSLASKGCSLNFIVLISTPLLLLWMHFWEAHASLDVTTASHRVAGRKLAQLWRIVFIIVFALQLTNGQPIVLWPVIFTGADAQSQRTSRR